MKEKFKKKLSTILIVSIIIAYFLFTFIIGAGFTLNPNVKLADFTVSEDGTKIILKTSVNSHSESVRKYTYINSGVAC